MGTNFDTAFLRATVYVSFMMCTRCQRLNESLIFYHTLVYGFTGNVASNVFKREYLGVTISFKKKCHVINLHYVLFF